MNRKSFRVSVAAFLFLLISFSGLSSANVYAWGPEGHEVVAIIAFKHLTPTARQRFQQLVGNQSLGKVANFADVFRTTHKETSEWHFVDIQLADNDYEKSRDCKEVANNEITSGDCVVEAVKHFRKVLADGNQSKAKRAMALAFLVHFVGDMHQPLHDADNHDRGGNDVKVNFFGTSSNLHKVWDSGLINRNGLSSGKLATQLDAGVSGSNITAIQKGDLEDWVRQAHKLAQTNAYDIPNNHVIGKPYFQRNMPVVEVQLTRAGLRLARILNEVLN